MVGTNLWKIGEIKDEMLQIIYSFRENRNPGKIPWREQKLKQEKSQVFYQTKNLAVVKNVPK